MSFRAMYEGGMCPAGCGERLHIGDEVEYVDDVLMHVNCTPKPDPLEIQPTESVCSDCWMVYTTAAGHECG